jgi:hypothetical protein
VLNDALPIAAKQSSSNFFCVRTPSGHSDMLSHRSCFSAVLRLDCCAGGIFQRSTPNLEQAERCAATANVEYNCCNSRGRARFRLLRHSYAQHRGLRQHRRIVATMNRLLRFAASNDWITGLTNQSRD